MNINTYKHKALFWKSTQFIQYLRLPPSLQNSIAFWMASWQHLADSYQKRVYDREHFGKDDGRFG